MTYGGSRSSFSRVDKVKKALMREISELIASEIKDPLLDNQIISVTEVDVSKDFAVAKIYLSLLTTSANPEAILDVLNAAAPKLQNIVGKRLQLRNTTKLSFYLDDSLQRGSRVHELLKQLSTDEPPVSDAS
jgi:ribosome-binding factor A